MDWATLGEEIIKLGAPLLGAAISGGVSAVAKTALVEAFNAAGETPEQITEAMGHAKTEGTDVAAKVQELEQQHAPNLAG